MAAASANNRGVAAFVLQHSGGCGKRCGLAGGGLVSNNDECWPCLAAGSAMQPSFGAAPLAKAWLVSYASAR